MKRNRLLLMILILTAVALSGCVNSPAGVSGTEAMTGSKTEAFAETSHSTEAESGAEDVSSTEMVPDTEEVPSTETVPDTEEMTPAETMPDTEDVSSTDTEPTTEAVLSTEIVSTTEAVPSTEAVSSTEALPPLTINDIAFVGDSRTLTMASGGGLEFYLVPSSSVFATWGGELTHESAKNNAVNAAVADRELAIFWYGINDVQSDPGQTLAAQFKANYSVIIDLYRNLNPDSEIVILSILSTSVNEKDYYIGQEENIQTYNAHLAALCAENGYTYLDITSLFTGDECLAPNDNIHFSKEWYETSFLPTVLGALGIEY